MNYTPPRRQGKYLKNLNPNYLQLATFGYLLNTTCFFILKTTFFIPFTPFFIPFYTPLHLMIKHIKHTHSAPWPYIKIQM